MEMPDCTNLADRSAWMDRHYAGQEDGLGTIHCSTCGSFAHTTADHDEATEAHERRPIPEMLELYDWLGNESPFSTEAHVKAYGLVREYMRRRGWVPEEKAIAREEGRGEEARAESPQEGEG